MTFRLWRCFISCLSDFQLHHSDEVGSQININSDVATYLDPLMNAKIQRIGYIQAAFHHVSPKKVFLGLE